MVSASSRINYLEFLTTLYQKNLLVYPVLSKAPPPFYFVASAAMEAIQRAFAKCKKQSRLAFVPYVTAGYPTAEETVSILLGMEAGGAGA